MDLSVLPTVPGRLQAQRTTAADPAAAASFRNLIGQIGREITAPMTSALERVNNFATTGRIDRSGLRALREEIECARRLALGAQQFSRFASGRVRQNPQRLNLTHSLRDALAQRGRETASRGIDLRQELKPAEIIVDASMWSALLQALLDWSFQHARSHIEFRIDVKSWPAHARLVCRFAFIPPDELASQHLSTAQRLETVPWQLLCHLSRSLGMQLHREDQGGSTRLTMEFPNTVKEGVATPGTLEPDEAGPSGPNSQPMVGRHVLVIAARRETRNAVRETLRSMGLMVDYVATIEEARQFCESGLPHAIIFEAALAGDNFRKLRAEWSRDVPTLGFIEIAEQGRNLEVSDIGGQRTSRIGRDVIASALPSALNFELSQDG